MRGSADLTKDLGECPKNLSKLHLCTESGLPGGWAGGPGGPRPGHPLGIYGIRKENRLTDA